MLVVSGFRIGAGSLFYHVGTRVENDGARQVDTPVMSSDLKKKLNKSLFTAVAPWR